MAPACVLWFASTLGRLEHISHAPGTRCCRQEGERAAGHGRVGGPAGPARRPAREPAHPHPARAAAGAGAGRLPPAHHLTLHLLRVTGTAPSCHHPFHPAQLALLQEQVPAACHLLPPAHPLPQRLDSEPLRLLFPSTHPLAEGCCSAMLGSSEASRLADWCCTISGNLGNVL